MTQPVVSDATYGALGILKKKKTNLLVDPRASAADEAYNQAMAGLAGRPAPQADAQGLRNLGTEMAQGLSYDRQALEQTQVGEIERQAQDARLRLGRQFGIDPGGSDSGAAQRQFETLEGQVLGTTADVRTQLLQWEAEQKRANLEAVQGLYGTYTTADQQQRAQDIEAQKAVLATTLQQAEITGVFQGQPTLKAAIEDSLARAREAELTGEYQFADGRTVDTLAAELQDLNARLEEAKLTGLYTDEKGNAAQTLQGKLQDATIKIQERAQTLAEQQAAAQATGTWQGQQTLAARAQALNERIAESEATGLWGAVQTLESQRVRIDQQRLVLDQTKQALDAKIAASQATGDWEGARTLAALRLQLDQAAQDLESKMAAAEATGVWDGQATLEKIRVGIQQAAQALAEKKAAAEFTGTWDGNKTVQQQSLDLQAARDAVDAEIARGTLGLDSSRLALEQAAQALSAKIASANATGLWDGQQTLDAARVAIAQAAQALSEKSTAAQYTGRWEGAATVEQQRLDLQKAQQEIDRQIQIADLTGDYEGKATLERLRYDLEASGQALNQEISAANLTGTFRGQQTLAAGALKVQQAQQALAEKTAAAEATGQWEGVETLAGRRTTLDEQVAEAEQTGDWEGVKTLSAQRLALERETAAASYTGLWNGVETLDSLDQKLRASQQALDAKIAASQATGTWEGQDTLAKIQTDLAVAAQQLDRDIAQANATGAWDGQETLERERVNIQRLSQQLDQQIASANATGQWNGQPTLDSLRVSIAQANQAMQDRIAEADATGQWMGQDTLDRLKLDLDAQIAEAEQTGDWEGRATLDFMRYELADRTERNQMNLAWAQELSNTRLAEAELTGVIGGGSINMLDLGFPELEREADGSLTEEAQAQYELMADSFVQRFTARAGRAPTAFEVAAMLRGDAVTLEGRQTMAMQRQGLDAALARAQATGDFTDPITGQTVQTLQAQSQRFDQQMQTQQQALARTVQMAQTTGYVTMGSGGQLKAADLGVDLSYVTNVPATAAEAKTKFAFEWESIQSGYESTTGQRLSDDQVFNMLKGGSLPLTGDSLRVETLSARAQRQQNALAQGDLLGNLYGQKTQAARQFEQQLTLDTNLTQAQVGQIMAGISQSERELNQRIFEFAQESNLDWAQVFGITPGGGTGSLSLEAMGIQSPGARPEGGTPEQINAWQTEYNSRVDAARQTFRALEGRNLTNEEVASLMAGRSIQVEGQKTLAALQLAAQVSTDTLNRATQSAQFAQAHGLEVEKFNQSIIESDRNFAQAAQQAAQAHDLDVNQFLLAQSELRSQLTGRYGVTGDVSLESLGLQAPPGDPRSDEYAADMETLRSQVANRFLAATGQTLDAAGVDALIRGQAITVEEEDTQAVREWQAETLEVARRYNLDIRKFQEATREFNNQFELSEASSYASLYGTDINDPSHFTTAYQQYLDSRERMSEADARTDSLYQAVAAGGWDKQNVDGNELVRRGILTQEQLSTPGPAVLNMQDAHINMQSPDEVYGYIEDYLGVDLASGDKSKDDVLGKVLDVRTIQNWVTDAIRDGRVDFSDSFPPETQAALSLRQALRDSLGYNVSVGTALDLLAGKSTEISIFHPGEDRVGILAGLVNGYQFSVAEASGGGMLNLVGSAVGQMAGIYAGTKLAEL